MHMRRPNRRNWAAHAPFSFWGTAAGECRGQGVGRNLLGEFLTRVQSALYLCKVELEQICASSVLCVQAQ